MNIVQRIGHIPAFARFYAKYGYPAMTRLMRSGDEVLYLGPGYEEDPAMAITLDAADEPDRHHPCITASPLRPISAARRFLKSVAATAVAPPT